MDFIDLSSGQDYWQPQTIEVGESVIFTALYVIGQAANSGFITNTATAVGSITEALMALRMFRITERHR